MTTIETPRLVVPDLPTDLFVGGSWVSAASGRRFDVENPATGEIIATVADAGAAPCFTLYP